jgi:sortase A
VRQLIRIGGTLLVAAGLLTLLWVLVVWRWEDPFTAIYTHVQQSRLAATYGQRLTGFRSVDAAAYRRSLEPGDPVGRLKIPRIGLNMIVVQGTDPSDLERGPGHYIPSGLPGDGHLVYVAGHRTTFLAPFANIDKIRIGDPVQFSLPYGTYTYRVTRHYVVSKNDLAVLRDHGTEVLRLQACHPRFFATHRYIVDATLASFTPPVKSTSS